MKKFHGERSRPTLALILGLIISVTQPLSSALALPPTSITSSGLNTHVSAPSTLPNGQVNINITGGTRPGNGPNLFHSFGQFSVGTNNIANFLNDTGLPTTNILARVTGGNVSNIFGTIQTTGFGNANLFLMNPAGFLFGPTAMVNVGGMVAFTSANYLRLADAVQFNATPKPAADMLLSTAPVAAFGFLGSNPGAITVQGSQLSLASKTGLSLVGGNITISGTLSAPGGQVNLVSVASKGEVVRTTTPQGGADLDVTSFSHLGDVTLDGEGIAAGLTLIRGGQLVMNNTSIGPSPFHINGSPDARTVDIAVRGDALLQGSTIDTAQGATTITAQNLTLKNTSIGAGDTTAIEIANSHGTSVSLNASNNLTIDSASLVRIFHDESRPTDANISLSGGRIVMNGVLRTTGDAQTPGSISLDATKSINVTGTISTSVDQLLVTDSGNVTLQAPVVNVTRGTITARGGLNRAGDVTITGTNVSLTNGTTIDASGGINGGAGHITIQADKALVDHSSLNISSNIFNPITDTDPGRITIDANQSLIIRNGSTLSTNNGNLSPGLTGMIQAGTIHLEGGHKVIVQDSTVSANAGGANGGTIEIESPGVVRIENSVLSASTAATPSALAGHGGTIEIATPRKVVIQGSELQTNAAAGPGGTINITATKRVVEDAASVISATSATGPNGSVTITAPRTILHGVVEP